jgi:hypothetical protein
LAIRCFLDAGWPKNWKSFFDANFNTKAIYMKATAYTVAFNFDVRPAGLKIPLMAEVELHFSEPHYIVKNIRMVGGIDSISVLPDLDLKKIGGRWVHSESEKESELSIGIGKAIDAIWAQGAEFFLHKGC